jgi:predicted  nucleic acid-binding Zn-ribbon protein
MTTSTRPTTYDTDFYTWTQQQAELLRQEQIAGLDWQNLAEEIESLGRSDYRSLVSAIEQLTLHLLNWQHQSEKRSRSWEDSIDKQRAEIEKLLDDSPGLKSKLDEAITKGYRYGRRGAGRATRLPLETLPEACPYSWVQLTDEDWLPD